MESSMRFSAAGPSHQVSKQRPGFSRHHSAKVSAVISPPQRPQYVKDAPTVDLVSNAPGASTSGTGNNFWSVVSGTRGFASQLLSHFRPRPGSVTTQEQAEKVLQEAAVKEKEKQATTQPADIRAFLKSVGVWELKHIRKLSAMCALTYKMYKVTPRHMKRCFNVELVTTSWACELHTYEHVKSAEEVLAEGDGMGVSVQDANVQRASQKQEMSNIVPLPKNFGKLVASQTPQPAQPARRWSSPADVVAAKLAEAASAASAVAVTPIASAAGSLYAGLVSLPPLASALASSSKTSAPVLAAAAVAVAESKVGSSNNISKLDNKQGQLSGTTVSSTCPSEWYVCDDHASNTRYFVIQGSDTIDHWKLNLTFDPVIFEDPALGVKVHRGVYEAAQILYDRFLPLVYEHLDSSPFAKVCFTGHSIGGSLGTLLMLMYKQRGVCKENSIANTYTFGAPAVFSESESYSLSSSGFTMDKLDDMTQAKACRGLLHSLGLQEDTIRNVIMHQDIVPRAFACDYSLVADILRGWGPGFRDHAHLSCDGRKHLYYFVGYMMVLQPDEWHSFVDKDGYHSMLPHGPGLYLITQPDNSAPAPAASSLFPLPAAAEQEVLPEEGASNDELALVAVGAKQVSTVPEAVWELMDHPHPLDILADPAAYLSHGSISRYHNPENYTMAMGRLIHLKRLHEERCMPDWVAAAVRRGRQLQLASADDAKALAPWDSSEADVDAFKVLSTAVDIGYY